MDTLVSWINTLLQKRAFCQTKAKDFVGEVAPDEEGGEEFEDAEEEDEEQEEEEDPEDLDHDEVILGNSTDLVICLAKIFGDQFLPYFSQIAPHLRPYLEDSHPKNDKIMVIGCIGETIKECPSAVSVFYSDYMGILLKLAASHDSQDSGLMRNIAYAIGVLAESARSLFPQHLQECLNLLSRFFHCD